MTRREWHDRERGGEDGREERPPQSTRSSAGISTDQMIRDLWEEHFGDGTDLRPGMKVRVDRIEQKLNIFSWVTGISLGAAIVAAVTAGWNWITAGHGGGK